MPELPPPDVEAQALSAQLAGHIRAAIVAAGGRLGFDVFMQHALYEPGLGYYVAGLAKFGRDGDFLTAPERSPLFGRTLARQIAQVLASLPDGELLEFGAGSGALAADLLTELDQLGCLPRRYLILELSAELQQRQREAIARRLPQVADRVLWLDRLPQGFRGVMVANEVLDAMPVRRFRVSANGIVELYVAAAGEHFTLIEATAQDDRLAERVSPLDLPAGYESEVNFAAEAWMQTVCACLERGLLLVIDYGYPRAEYYHAQRAAGTLLCHYRHQAHGDALRWPGLQDITAHLDFTALAQAAVGAGATLAGFANQAQFLIDCGLPQLLEQCDPNAPAYMDLALGARQLLLPQAMGEVFKVLAVTHGIDIDSGLIGFASGNRRHRL